MSFTNEHTVKAVRKARGCCACGLLIELGSSAVEWSGMADGEFNYGTYHVECRAAEIALNKHNATWGDEWLSLSEVEDDDWPFLRDLHPLVAERLRIPPASASQTVDDASGMTPKTVEENP